MPGRAGIAVALIAGDASVFRYSDATLADPRVAAMMARIEVAVDKTLDVGYPDKRGCRVEIRAFDGRRLSAHIDNAKGEPEHSFSRADIERKFALLMRDILGARSDQVIQRVMALEKLDDLNALAALLHADTAKHRSD